MEFNKLKMVHVLKQKELGLLLWSSNFCYRHVSEFSMTCTDAIITLTLPPSDASDVFPLDVPLKYSLCKSLPYFSP